MPVITSLKPQKNGKRVNVYVDNQFAFGIDLDNLVIFGIKINKEFSSEQLNKIIKQAEFQKTFDKLLNFVTIRPRSEKEVNMWFRRKKVPESLYGELKQRIVKLELLNDEEFAKWWINQRIEYKKKSKKEIKYELQNKGIDRKLVDNLLDDVEIDEEKLARELLTKKHPKHPDQFLLRRGFNWDIVRKLTKTPFEE